MMAKLKASLRVGAIVLPCVRTVGWAIFGLGGVGGDRTYNTDSP